MFACVDAFRRHQQCYSHARIFLTSNKQRIKCFSNAHYTVFPFSFELGLI